MAVLDAETAAGAGDEVTSHSVVWDAAGRNVVPATAGPKIVGLFHQTDERSTTMQARG
jgi:hypothetical protein